MRVFRYLFAVIVAAFLAGPALAADGDLKAQLQVRYDDLKTAMQARNASAISAILAPGFRSVDVDDKVESADQMVAEVVALPVDPNKVSQTTLISVQGDDHSATVEQTYDMRSIKNVGGDLHTVHLAASSVDLWVNVDSVWLYKETATKKISYSMDQIIIYQKSK